MNKTIKLKKNNTVLCPTDDGDLVNVEVLEFVVSETKEDDADDIFGSMLTVEADDSIMFYMAILPDSKRNKHNQVVDWLTAKVKQESFIKEKYPEELIASIAKSVSNSYHSYKAGLFESNEEKINLFNEFHKSNYTKIDDIIQTLNKRQTLMEQQINKAKALSGGLDIYSFLDRYMFKKHVLIRGERGGGKTFAVDSVARSIPDAEFIFLAGSEGLDETDLRGMYSRNDDGKLIWLDGVLTQAFRLAKTKKVILMIDELLRIKSKELNILVGSLTPSSIGTYRLNTNRIMSCNDNIGTGELIEIPVENLWVVGTTNIGAKYNVDEMDSALVDRFRILDKRIESSEVHSVVSKRLNHRGFNTSLADKFVELYIQVNNLFEIGELDNKLNIRHLTEAIDFADDEQSIKSYIFDLAPYVCGDDVNGNLSKAEKDIFNRTVKKIF